MLYTHLLRDKLQDILAGTGSLGEAADRIAAEEDVFFSERFLLPRPLLRAIQAEKPMLLLIDEIDRADAEFEAFFLGILSDFQISVPELGTLTAKQRPAVVLTSNNTRELSEALKRRSLYVFIDYPSVETELRIVRRAVEAVHKLRGLGLKKNPSVQRDPGLGENPGDPERRIHRAEGPG